MRPRISQLEVFADQGAIDVLLPGLDHRIGLE